MFVIATALNKEYHSQEILDMLKSIPDMTWTPAIPARFRGITVEEMKNLYTKNTQRFHAAPKMTYRATKDLPASFSWLNEKPECLKVRDQG